MGARDYLNQPLKQPETEWIKPDENVKLSDVFFGLTRQLRSQFCINRGVLVLRDKESTNLSAVSTWHDGRTRDGLTIRLPSDSSLFERVAAQGSVYTEDFCESFSGNFFERKLLIDENSRSFVLHPMKHEGEVVGLLGFSSEEPIAFSMFEEGTLETIVSDFAKLIHKSELIDE